MAEIYNPEFADDYKSFLFYKARKQLKQETFEIHTFTELKLRYIKDTLDRVFLSREVTLSEALFWAIQRTSKWIASDRPDYVGRKLPTEGEIKANYPEGDTKRRRYEFPHMRDYYTIKGALGGRIGTSIPRGAVIDYCADQTAREMSMFREFWDDEAQKEISRILETKLRRSVIDPRLEKKIKQVTKEEQEHIDTVNKALKEAREIVNKIKKKIE